MGKASDVVTAFLAAVEAKDLDAALALVTDDIPTRTSPSTRSSARMRTAAVLRGFLEPAATVDWRIVRQVEVDGVVINERLDRFEIGSGWLELPIAGFFEVTDDGLIRRWRDYFDMATYTRQLAELTAG